MIALAFLLAGLPITTHAADNSAPVHNVDGSLVREWLVLGPFPAKSLNIDFLADAGGEANARPKEGDAVTRSDGTRLSWTRLHATTDYVNLEQVLGISLSSIFYAYCELKSDQECESEIRSYYHPRLWVNGKEEARGGTWWGRNIDLTPVVPIQLNAGQNACLLKFAVVEWQSMLIFQPLPAGRATAEVHVTDPAGKNVGGALVQFYDQGEVVGRLKTDQAGKAVACLYPLAEKYDVRITSGEMGTWLFEMALQPGERLKMDATLTNAVSISGQTLAMDGSPQNAIVVQAIRVPENSGSTASSSPIVGADVRRPSSQDQKDGDQVRDSSRRLLQTSGGAALPRRPENGVERQFSPAGKEPTPSPLPGGELAAGAHTKAPLLGGAGGGSSTPPNLQTKPLLPTPGFSETVLSDTNGFFRFVNLRPGQYRLRCHGQDGFVSPEAVQGTNAPGSLVFAVEPGRAHQGIKFVFPEAKKGVWKNYPITQGLSEVSTRGIHRTPDGLLWVGTDQSFLYAFDGAEFKMMASSPAIPADQILTLECGIDGTLWIGTAGGISRHVEGRTERFSLSDVLPRKWIDDILVDPDGMVWFATSSGLVRYDGRSLVTFTTKDGLPSNGIRSLLRARDGTLWLGTAHSLVRFDGQSSILLEPFDGFSRRDIGSLHQARDGSIWFGTATSGAYRYDGKTFSPLGMENGLFSDEISDIAETSDGALWFATQEGLSRFDGTTVVNYTEKDGLISRAVRNIHVDSDDVLWCGTAGGVSRFDSKGFTRFTNRDGLRQAGGETAGVLSIEPDPDGRFWIGTGWGGVYRTDGKILQAVPSNTGWDYVRQIHHSADGTVWFGGTFGIKKYEDKQFLRVLQRDWVIAMYRDDEGNLWYGHGWNDGGLSRYNPKTGESALFTTAQGLPHDQVWSVERSLDGGLWVGTSGGLARYRDGKIEDFREKLGIPTGAVYNLRRDAEGTLWISSRLGLHRLENVSNVGADVRRLTLRNDQRPITNGQSNQSLVTSAPTMGTAPPNTSLEGFTRVSITATNGLPDEHIWCSARTRDGIIWMGTERNGLLGYDGKAVTVIDKRDGLLGNQILAVATNGDGSLWVGSLGGGLDRYQPSKLRPSVRLRSVQVEGQTFTNYSKLPNIETGRRVTIEYREIDLKTHPEKRQFWYRLADRSGQTVFSGVTKDRHFDWTPPKGGAYSFEVQAIDRDLNYSVPAQVAFRVTVPWYANAWILTPAGGTFGGLFVWAFIARALYVRKGQEAARLREQLLAQESRTREELEGKNRQLQEAKQAADIANRAKSTFLANMSHEIRTPLNAVLGYAQILQRDESLGDDQRQSVATIERSGTHLLTVINEILDLSKIEAGHMELSETDFDLRELIIGLSDMFEPRCRQKGLVWRVEVESGVQSPMSNVQCPEAEGGSTTENAENAESGKQLTTDHTDSTDERKTGDIPYPCPSVSSVVNSSELSLHSLRSLRLTPIPVHGDEGKLRQVLINLLGNAVKFTDTGQVTLRLVGADVRRLTSIELEVGDQVRASSRRLLHFEVEDTGPGIPASIREKIFEPFTQGAEGRRKGGTGLGLTIARRHIELMGGELQVHSEPGRGSRFSFSLALPPAWAELPPRAETARKRAKRLQTGTRLRALIADDVAENRDILSRLLRELGAEVTVWEDGEQALKELRAERYDIAFLDIRMPKLTGFQVAQEALGESRAAQAKLVAISASVLEHEQKLYQEVGFDAFIPKPFRFEEICDCLERLLGLAFEYDAVSPDPNLTRNPNLPPASESESKITSRIRSKTEEHLAAPNATPADFDPRLAERWPLRILLADDYDENRKLGARILQGFGYGCELASNGREVIQALERQPFDLVFLDVHMPEMDGYEAARQIRECWSDAERPWLVAMTASVARGDRQQCLEAGMDDYIPKPVEIAEIRRVLEQAGKRSSQRLPGRSLARTGEEALIDWVRLERMLGEDRAILREFLDAYLQKTSEQLEQMLTAMNSSNAAEVEILAHRCKGASANFGINAMVQPMASLEDAALSGNLSNGPRLLAEAQEAFALVQKTLRRD